MAEHREPLRVLHVMDILAVAGMEYGVIKLVNRLPRERFRPMICCLRDQRAGTQQLLSEDVRVFELHRAESLDWKVVPRLARLLWQERIDVVHSHNWSAFFYSVAARKISRRAVLIHGEHGYETKELSARQVWASRCLARMTDHLATVTDVIAKELESSWRVPLSRITTVPNGVDLDRFGIASAIGPLRAELDLRPEHYVVLTIGGLRPVKDHATLIRGFARLYRTLPQARLLIVGKVSPGPHWPQIDELVKTLGLEKVVLFAGLRHDIPELLSLCNVYVNSSIYEGMSNTILEAMASRRPVVATAVGGNVELVKEGETGYLFPVGDDARLAERLRAILMDGVLAEKLGRAGRRVVERDHTMTRMVQDYADLYQEVYEQRHCRPRS